MNELEKRARKHKRKQKYPMSIFPDYKKGAEEFNKNSTPINQDALSSADASSGMAEDIERNKKKGINEEMDDFLYWEIAEPQCTGYDCDDNIEYVYGDDENRVWIEQDGRKYKVFVNQVDEKPTATFTSLNKAKAFGEKYWQDNYGYINESYSYEEKYRGCKILGDFNGEGPYTVVCLHKEYECPTREEAMKKIDDLLDNNKKDESLNETLEYNEDIKIDGFEFSEYENHHTGEMEVETYYNGDWVCSCEYNGWDGLRIVDENSHYRGIINEEDVEQLDVDDFYDYCLNLKDEFEERNRSAFDPMDESLSEEYIPDITQRYPEGFNGESAYRTPWDDEYRAWDELSKQQKEEEEEFERLKKTAKYKLIREYDDYDSEEDFFQTKQDALNYADRLCDYVYKYNKDGHKHPLTYLTLENIKTGKSKRVSIEDMLDYYNGTNQTNESLNEDTTQYNMINEIVKKLGNRTIKLKPDNKIAIDRFRKLGYKVVVDKDGDSLYDLYKKTKNESLNENCNSYQYKGKTIINAGDYWFVKGYKEKFPTSDEAEEFIDDKKKDEGVNINIRESLNKMDAESDNTYDLLNLYESKNLSRKQKKDIARMIYENYGLERIYNYLYEATEESEDELPVEDRIKELTNSFKNTNGSYVFEDGQDANKAVSTLKSRGYEASQKRTQDGKYRVTANKK